LFMVKSVHNAVDDVVARGRWTNRENGVVLFECAGDSRFHGGSLLP
jgi:hypothetical protein